MSLEIARALTPADTPGTVTSAVITSVEADGTVTVDLGGGRLVPNCRVLTTYTPNTGESVEVMRRDANTLLVLGDVRSGNVTTLTVTDSLLMAWNVTTAATVGGSSGSLTVASVSTKSARTGKWERDEVYQGAYSPQYGYWRGCYFYGSGFSSLSGKTCTRLRLHVSRRSEGGIAGAEDVYIAPHIHATRPSGSPVFKASAVKIGTLSWGSSADFDLPIAWGNALIQSTIRGFGHIKDSTSVYSIFNSKAQDSLSGRVILDWQD